MACLQSFPASLRLWPYTAFLPIHTRLKGFSTSYPVCYPAGARCPARSDHPHHAQPSSQLGFAFIVGLVTSLWTASSGVRALIDALNIVYGEEEKA
jgi:Predicted membrane protein